MALGGLRIELDLDRLLRPEGAMGRYRVRVVTGTWLFSGSVNLVRLWLVGAHREAKLQLQLRPARGKVSEQELGLSSVRVGSRRLARDRRLGTVIVRPRWRFVEVERREGCQLRARMVSFPRPRPRQLLSRYKYRTCGQTKLLQVPVWWELRERNETGDDHIISSNLWSALCRLWSSLRNGTP